MTKLKLIMSLAVLIFGSVAGLVSAQAQVADETEVANVPFDFYAGGQKMPAGNYTIGIDLEGQRITLSAESGKHTIFLMGMPAREGDDQSELVFEHSGNVYALKEVKSDLIDLTFHTTVPEQELESRTASTQVEVAMAR